MKRLTLWTALLVLCCVPAFAGDDSDSLSSNTGEDSTCTYRTADEIVQEWRESTPAAGLGRLPSCPPESNSCTGGTTACGGNNPCEASGQTTLADTGLQACQADNGRILRCKEGQSVHVKSKACGQCDCCSSQPACVCPNDCGEIAEISCR